MIRNGKYLLLVVAILAVIPLLIYGNFTLGFLTLYNDPDVAEPVSGESCPVTHACFGTALVLWSNDQSSNVPGNLMLCVGHLDTTRAC